MCTIFASLLIFFLSCGHTSTHTHTHTNATHPVTHCSRRAPPMLCSHVERPEQLGASVSQRLDLLPRAGMEEGWKRVRGREGVMNNWGDWGEGMGGLHEDGFRKVIGRDGGGGWRAQSYWQKQWLGKQSRGVEGVGGGCLAGRRKGGNQRRERGERGDMDMSQGPVERKAHGARMPTDPPSHPVLYQREERKKKGRTRKQSKKCI